MNHKLLTLCALALGAAAQAQLQVDQHIQMTGPDGSRRITHVETPVNGTDAVNKDYVDAAVAAGGNDFVPTMMSQESPSDLLWSQCVTYCRDLVEGGYSDWVVATVGDLVTLLGKDGYTIPQNTSANWAIFMVDRNGGMQSAYPYHRYQFSVGYFINTTSHASTGRARCVR